ncbi:MAG: DUF4352 domain-containing protein, partial [Planctomycetes bacterium]|nr:DUF4352 domain-containing protein [Planctomycetota bacterium]
SGMRHRRASLVLLSTLAVAQPGCVGFSLSKSGEAHPPSAKFAVDARVDPARRGYYVVRASIQNGSDAPLIMDPTMFSLTAPDPVSFVLATRIGFVRRGFRIPAHVPPGASTEGEIYYASRGIAGGWFPLSLFWTGRPTTPVVLRVALPDGEHSFQFELD